MVQKPRAEDGVFFISVKLKLLYELYMMYDKHARDSNISKQTNKQPYYLVSDVNRSNCKHLFCNDIHPPEQ